MLFKYLILGLVILIPHVATGKDKEPGAGATMAPAENPPEILVAKSITEAGNLVLVQYQTIFIGMKGASYNHRALREVPLDDVKIYTVRGEKVSIEMARDRLGGTDTPILCSSWRRDLPEFYAGLFTPESLHFVFPKKSPQWKMIEDPGAFVR
jgi:hypothetical protein